MVKFRENTEKFVDFMMRFELNLELPDPNRSWVRNSMHSMHGCMHGGLEWELIITLHTHRYPH